MNNVVTVQDAYQGELDSLYELFYEGKRIICISGARLKEGVYELNFESGSCIVMEDALLDKVMEE